jgi:pyridoxine 4-dehydrogenase
VQNMYNLGERKWEEVVDYTAKRKMAFIPWYPLAAGPGKLEDKIRSIAAKHHATTAQIALAWLLHRSPNILLIPGTSSIAHMHENMGAGRISLFAEEIRELTR